MLNKHTYCRDHSHSYDEQYRPFCPLQCWNVAV